MNPVVRLGLIGAGAWGMNYLKTIKNIEGVEVELIACKNIQNKSYINNSYNVVDSWLEVIKSSKVDGIIIASPPSTHFEIALETIKNNKQVIIEKPMTLDLGHAKILLDLALKYKVNVKVNHIYLYHPMYIFLKNFIKDKANLKSLNSLSGNYGPFREDVSPLWDWGPHDLALCLDLMGEMPLKIEAKFADLEINSNQINSNIITKLFFSNGKYAELKFGNLMESKKRFIKLNFENNSYIFDPIKYQYIQEENNLQLTELNPKDISKCIWIENSPLEILIKDFMEDITKKRFKTNDIESANNVIEIIESIEKILKKDYFLINSLKKETT